MVLNTCIYQWHTAVYIYIYIYIYHYIVRMNLISPLGESWIFYYWYSAMGDSKSSKI